MQSQRVHDALVACAMLALTSVLVTGFISVKPIQQQPCR